jgi:hypothetical protein
MSFTYQSYLNDKSQWFTMFTLCLAPLVSHLALGLPRTVIMSPEPAEDSEPKPSSKPSHLYPHWSERIALFNPVTLVWRYYGILYYRIRRGRSWDAADLAAANAAFWDPKTRRWDSTDRTLYLSRRYLTTPPELSHVNVVSGSTLSTLVLTLQGVQALFFMIGETVSVYNAFPDGLPTIFLPIGLLGLLRLPAATWVSNDWGFAFPKKGELERRDTELSTFRNDLDYQGGGRLGVVEYAALEAKEAEATGEDLEQKLFRQDVSDETRPLLKTTHWKCQAYRAWWIVSVSGLMILGIRDIVNTFNPYVRNIPLSVSDTLYSIMYLELCSGMLLITAAYVPQPRAHARTIIPCVQSLWYKFYTGLMGVTALATIVVACLETVQLPDGEYTTVPPLICYGDSCEPWNRTVVIEYAGLQWDRYLNVTS